MPVYGYECETCGPFTAIRSLEQFDAPAECLLCGQAARRSLSLPRMAVMGRTARIAAATNERASHEPKRAHGAGCGCCGPKSKPSTPEAIKGFPSKRPWMISH